MEFCLWVTYGFRTGLGIAVELAELNTLTSAVIYYHAGSKMRKNHSNLKENAAKLYIVVQLLF
jgi:hypothetical protein